MTVRVAGSGDRARWDAFVERCPEATFFHREGWQDIIESVFRHHTFYLIAERDTTIVVPPAFGAVVQEQGTIVAAQLRRDG